MIASQFSSPARALPARSGSGIEPMLPAMFQLTL
jgi:hypothetical protein